MKSSALFGTVFLALGLCAARAANETKAPAPAAAAQPANGSIQKELPALAARIKAKIDNGAVTEEALADELKAFDKLIADHRAEKSDAVAEAMYIEATLYSKVIENYDKASALLQTVKTEFPRTQVAFAATELLDQLDLEKETHAVQAALKPGTVFPDFSAKDIAGAPLSVSQYKGKVVLVDFWATWCGPCVSELPNVQAAYGKFHGKGFEIVGISLDQSEDRLKGFLSEKKITWQQYFDGKGWESTLGRKYGVNSIPATYLLDRNGHIVAKNLRGPALERELERLLAN